MSAKFIGKDEWWPVFVVSDELLYGARSVEVPDELMTRYHAHAKEFASIQRELRELYTESVYSK